MPFQMDILRCRFFGGAQIVFLSHHSMAHSPPNQSLEPTAGRLNYELVHSSTFHLQPAAPSAAWLILFSLGP